MSEAKIRALTLRDLDRILEIDEANTGVSRRSGDNDLWRLIAETTTCFGAEVAGKLVGFVLADVRPWEFGNRAHVGWVIAIGIDPSHQKGGIGTLLGNRALEAFRKLGVTEFKTLVGDDENLRSYFRRLGFGETTEIVLSIREAEPSPPPNP